MNDRVRAVIDELTEQLRALAVQELEIQQQRTTLRRRIRNLRRLSAERQQVEQQQADEPRVRDRDGTVIRIGDRVAFLTRGAFDSTEGIVISANRLWVTARDSDRVPIKRSPRNVRVLPRDE